MRSPTLDTFSEFINIAYGHNVPVSGSIGRAALIGDATISPTRLDGSVRDIDIVNVGPHSITAALLPDDLEFDRIWLSRFIQDGNLVYPGEDEGTAASEPKVIIPLPHLEQVFESTGGRTINGLECITLRPETQLAIDSMFGNVRKKNTQQIERLSRMVAQIPESKRLDVNLLEPFAQYAESVQGLWRRKFYLGARATYHTLLPLSVKAATHPFIKKIARKRLV